VGPVEGQGVTLAGNERWYLAHTLPRCEAKAQFHLGAQGFQTFLPQFVKTVRHARQLRNVRAALFPNYIFVIIDPTRDRWLSIRSTVGVSSLVTCDGRPLAVPEGIVEALIERTDPSNITRLDVDLVEGQSVRILTGPFANFVGTLDKLSGNDRVRVLLQLMGSEVPVSVRRSSISRAA
jgi:transcription elongation factor/antiterminator RfaH